MSSNLYQTNQGLAIEYQMTMGIIHCFSQHMIYENEDQRTLKKRDQYKDAPEIGSPKSNGTVQGQ